MHTTVSPCSRRRRTAARSAGSSPHGARIAAARRRVGSKRRDRLDVQAEADRRPVATEDRADLVVASAAQQRIAGARRIDRETRPAVVGIATEIGQIDAELHLRMHPRRRARPERPDRRVRAAVRAAPAARSRARSSTSGRAVQAEQLPQPAARLVRETAHAHPRARPHPWRPVPRRRSDSRDRIDRNAAEQRAHDAGVAEIERELADARPRPGRRAPGRSPRSRLRCRHGRRSRRRTAAARGSHSGPDGRVCSTGPQ